LGCQFTSGFFRAADSINSGSQRRRCVFARSGARGRGQGLGTIGVLGGVGSFLKFSLLAASGKRAGEKRREKVVNKFPRAKNCGGRRPRVVGRKESASFEAKIGAVLIRVVTDSIPAMRRRAKGGFALDNRAAMLQGGKSGAKALISPGASGKEGLA